MNVLFSYDLDNLKFGKIDVGRYPEAAAKYHVNDSSLSKQLPTIILFKDGKEAVRRPMVDSKGKLVKFFFTEVCTISILKISRQTSLLKMLYFQILIDEYFVHLFIGFIFLIILKYFKYTCLRLDKFNI